MSMMTVYVEFPQLTRKLLTILKHVADIDYQDAAVEIDGYIEQIVRLHVLARKYGVADVFIREFFTNYIQDNPLFSTPTSEKFWLRHQLENTLEISHGIWRAVERDLTFLPQSDFLLWHVGEGVWKMLTTGVSYHA